MEPRIQYAQTKDGVSIAYTQFGDGPPLIITSPSVWSHIGSEGPRIPDFTRLWREGLASRNRVVRFDIRGSGLSERNITSFTPDDLVVDLAAVADELELDRFALMGPFFGGRLAIEYAARHPERVSRLVLYCSFGPGQFRSVQAEMATALADRDWELFTETIAHATVGWEAGEYAHSLAMYMRESVTPEGWKAMTTDLRANAADVTELLRQITAPTLVLHLRELAVPDLSHARYLASQIPAARLLLLEGKSLIDADQEAVVAAIDEFLSEGEEAEPKSDLPEGTAVILFADIAESTALTEQLGDAAFRAKARELDASLRAIIRELRRQHPLAQTLGDLNREGLSQRILLRGLSEHDVARFIELTAGDVIREGNNVYGGAVNIAARIAGASAPGEVLVSDTVRGLARTSAGVTFDDRGEHVLKGVADPQRLFAVREGNA